MNLEHHDIADTPLASEETGIETLDPCEGLIEELRMSRSGVTEEQEAIVREWFDNGGAGSGGDKDTHSALAEILYMFTETRDARVLAWVFLLLIGKCPYSGEDVAKMCGHTRASFSKIKRELEERFGVRCRVHLDAAAIEQQRALCVDRGPRKEKATPWKLADRLARNLGTKSA